MILGLTTGSMQLDQVTMHSETMNKNKPLFRMNHLSLVLDCTDFPPGNARSGNVTLCFPQAVLATVYGK